MACDLIIASDLAAFGLPEVGLGVIPGHGGTARLADWVGSARARELIFSGRRVKADEAERIGLANRVVPHDQLSVQTLELAQAIAAQSPTAVAAAKRALRSHRQAATDQAMATETREFAALFGSPDQQEGMAAFAEKRQPRFGR